MAKELILRLVYDVDSPIPTPTPTPTPSPTPGPTPTPTPSPTPTPTPSSCYADTLEYSESSICTEDTSNVYYMDDPAFCSATVLYSDSFCTTLADVGYYKTTGDPGSARFWNGFNFTAGCQTCP